MAAGFKAPHKLAAVLLKATLAYDDAGALKVLSPIRHHIMVNFPPQILHILEVEQYYIQLISEHATVDY